MTWVLAAFLAPSLAWGAGKDAGRRTPADLRTVDPGRASDHIRQLAAGGRPEPLLPAFENPHLAVRLAAAEALGEIRTAAAAAHSARILAAEAARPDLIDVATQGDGEDVVGLQAYWSALAAAIQRFLGLRARGDGLVEYDELGPLSRSLTEQLTKRLERDAGSKDAAKSREARGALAVLKPAKPQAPKTPR